MDEKWDKRFLEMAKLVSTWSKDPTTQVGCVIVSRDRRSVSVGYNGFPPRLNDCPELLIDREYKRTYTLHAEVNAILNSQENLTRGGNHFYLYTTHQPCLDCAKVIASQQGIIRVVYYESHLDERWCSTEGLELLQSVGVGTKGYNENGS